MSDGIYTNNEPEIRDTSHRPLCPECHQPTVVLFSPPKDYLFPKDGTVHPDAYTLMGKQEYVDWNKAHLYCSNASTNCTFNTLLSDLGRTNLTTKV